MVDVELSDIEIERGLLLVPYAPECRSLWISYTEVLCARALGAMFHLDKADAKRLFEKAERLKVMVDARD